MKWNHEIIFIFFFFRLMDKMIIKLMGYKKFTIWLRDAFFLPNSFSFTYRYFSPFYLVLVVGRMALKLATVFLVFLLSLAFVSSKTEDQNAKLHDRKGLIEVFHWISSKSYFLVRWKLAVRQCNTLCLWLCFLLYVWYQELYKVVNLPTTKGPEYINDISSKFLLNERGVVGWIVPCETLIGRYKVFSVKDVLYD